MTTAWLILQVALGIGFLIFIHELGHFLMAKKVGIRVETFSIGFGPRIVGFTWGETEYRLAIIPLGGYVRMAGEAPGDEHTGSEREFSAKSVGERFQVIIAGVIMNALFAVVGFILAFGIGVEFLVPRVGQVRKGSPAEGHLQRGDRITAVNGKSILAFQDIRIETVFSDATEGLTLQVERDGQTHTVNLKPRMGYGDDFQQIGIEPILALVQVEEGSPAAEAGLQVGDIVLAQRQPGPLAATEEEAAPPPEWIPIGSEGDFEVLLARHPGTTFQLQVERDGRVLPDPVGLTTGEKPWYGVGIHFAQTPVILEVVPESAAEGAGLQPYDRVLTVNGEAVDNDGLLERVQASGGSPLELTIGRGEETKTLSVAPKMDGGRYFLGIAFAACQVSEVKEGSPAAAAGLQPGAVVTRYGEFDRITQDGLYRLALLQPEPTAPVEVAWWQGGQEHEAELTPVELDRKLGFAGLHHGPAMRNHQDGLVGAVKTGLDRTWLTGKNIFLMLNGLLAQKVSAKALGGPVLISKGAFQFAQLGFGTLLYFLALLSINLAILNLLPIPILDGGHVVFLAIEKIKGSPVSLRVMEIAQFVGLILLLALMIFVTVNDCRTILQ